MSTTATSHRIADADIERASAINIADIARARGLALKRSGREMIGACVHCGGTDRFSVSIRKNCFLCRHCFPKGGGGAIAFVMWLDGCGFREAVEALTGKRAAPTQRPDAERRSAERRAIETADLKRDLRYCDGLWHASVPLPPVAVEYFAGRAIDINAVPDQGGLRFHAACPFGGVTVPCILARFTDVTNAPGGIWWRPVTGEKPKAIGPIRGRVIRLWPDEHVEQGLVIGEGVETTLAAASLVTHQGTTLSPAWACGCAATLRDFPVLPGVEYLTILSDADANNVGQTAARACAQRWSAAGREAEVLTPTDLGTDFNDIARGSDD